MSKAENGDGSSYNEEGTTTLYSVLHRMTSSIIFSDPKYTNAADSSSLFKRIKSSFQEHIPLFPQASKNTGHHVLHWTRSGSPFRALLVISVGTISLVSLTGLLVFMLFFLAATVNAIVISLLLSLAAAGGFLAFFFAFLTAIYIGALSVAVLVISTTTVAAVIAILITTGWIGFFFTVWLTTKKSLGIAKHSLSFTGSALSAYTSTRRQGHGRYVQPPFQPPAKDSD